MTGFATAMCGECWEDALYICLLWAESKPDAFVERMMGWAEAEQRAARCPKVARRFERIHLRCRMSLATRKRCLMTA